MFHLINNFGYTGIFLTIFGEVALMLFPLPGDTLLFSSGILSDTGSFNYFYLLFGSIITSAIAGHVGYYIGSKISREKLTNNKYYRVKVSQIEKTEKFFEKYGVWAIVFSRYVPGVRSFISQILGVINYSQKKFFIYNLIASVIWPLVIITAGKIFGKFFPNLVSYAEYVIVFLLLLVFVPILRGLKKDN